MNIRQIYLKVIFYKDGTLDCQFPKFLISDSMT